MKVSTSTASRSAEIRVEDMGDHFISVTPGGKSPLTAAIWELTKTSHFNALFITLPSL
jgi:hypothetical protein